MTQFGAGYRATKAMYTKAGDLLAAEGDTCERVPESSLREWLIPQGLAVPLEAADAAPAAKASKKSKGDA